MKRSSNMVCISSNYYSTYSKSNVNGMKAVLVVESPEPLGAEFVEFMRTNPDKVRRGEAP